MVTREEAIVQIGVDGKPVVDGMQRIGSQIESFASKFNKFFSLGFGAGLAVQSINLIKQGLESLVIYFTTEYTRMWYGDSDALNRWSERLAESTAKLRELRKELGATAKEFSDALGSGIFKRATDADKENMTIAAIEAARKRTEAARHNRASMKEQSESASGNRIEFIKAVAEAEIELNKALAEELKLQDQLDDVQGRMADKRKKDAEDAKRKTEEEERARKKALDDKRRDDAEYVSRQSGLWKAGGKDLESFMPSLGDLASSGSFWGAPNSTQGFGFQSGPFAGAAQGIIALGQRATEQFTYGNVRGAHASIEERNRRYDQLAKAGIVPQRAEQVAEAQLKTAEILDGVRDGSITVQTALQLVKD